MILRAKAKMAKDLDCMCKSCIARQLKKLRKGQITIMSAISDFAAATQASFSAISASLDNIAADEANLAKQITDLQAQILASGTLSAEDLASLNDVANTASAMATKTAGIAAAVPDAPAPPPQP